MALLHWTVGLLVAAQATQPILLSGYNRLTPEHVRQIAAIAEDAGGASPWFITVQPTMASGFLGVEAYLQPTFERDTLRRGHMIYMTGHLSDDQNLVRSWEYRDFLDYAQVVMPGRAANDVRSLDDMNHPFRVLGDFTDDELLSMVTFFRAETVKWMGRDLRIKSVSRRDGSGTVEVSRWRDRSSWDAFAVRRENGVWTAVPTGMWVQ